MALTLQQIVDSLGRKLNRLDDAYHAALEAREVLEGENAALRSEVEQLREKVQILERDCEFLTMSHRLASSPDDVIDARRKLAAMIRDIDKCISQLKE